MKSVGLPLLELAERRLAWVDSRQRLLAQNIANADTPGWKPRDTAEFSVGPGASSLSFARTDPQHLSPASPPPLSPRRTGRESAPDGNAVSLDDQLARLAETETAHDLATDIYKKYIGFFRLAIGR